jgi:hypothetical protein
MRAAIVLASAIIAESIFLISLTDSRDNPQSAVLTTIVALFMVIFLAMDITEWYKKWFENK